MSIYKKVKVKVLKPINGFDPGDEMEMLEGNLKYFAGKVEVIKEKKKKAVSKKTAKNKAILTPKNTK